MRAIYSVKLVGCIYQVMDLRGRIVTSCRTRVQAERAAEALERLTAA